MESKTNISEESSEESQQLSVPSIHLESLLLDQHAHNISMLDSSSRQRSNPKIFTVAKTLKDPFILSSIKPDYGSLSEFIGDIDLSKDLLSQKRRKNDSNEQQLQEKKTRLALKQKTQQQLNTIFLTKTTNSMMKKVAGKLLIENLFKDSFGLTLTAFENQNVKPQPPRNVKINLSAIDDIFMGKRLTINHGDTGTTRRGHGEDQSDDDSKDSKVYLGETANWTKQQVLEIVEAAKGKYPSFRKLTIKDTCATYDQLVPGTNEENGESKGIHEEKKDKTKAPTHTIVTTDRQFIFQRMTIKPDLMLFLVTHFPLPRLAILNLYQVRVSQETLSFMLEIVRNFCRGLTSLSLRNISLEKYDGVVQRIKEMLEVLPLKELTLECLDLETKEFCVICLGIGANNTLQMLNFDSNGVDERGCKSLELITKHCLNLKKIYLRRNYVKWHHLSYLPAEAKAKIVL